LENNSLTQTFREAVALAESSGLEKELLEKTSKEEAS
jgi:hypothetical protein